MSGECSFFNFCLRGSDSLVSKWISQKRKIPGTLKSDGANIYAISEYIHTVFCFDKLYGSDYSSNELFNRIIKINDFDKNHIVKFDETIMIPFNFSPYEFSATSFDDMAKDVSRLELSAIKLSSVLSDSEIKELLINIYHINYDLREYEEIKKKSYDEIISEKFIDFQDKATLSFFIPYIFEISEKKVVESEETPVQVSLTVSSIQPEVSNIYAEGYFYTKDGKFVKQIGSVNNCYLVEEIKDIYQKSEVRNLSIQNDILNKYANTVAQESSGVKEEAFALASTIKNLATYRNKTILRTLETEGIWGYRNGGNDSTYKNNTKYGMSAAINAIIGGVDYSYGAIRWDGFDLAALGFEHDKPKNCGIRLSTDLFNKFKGAWPNDFITRYSGGKYTKFSEAFKAGDYKAIGRNKGCILYEASAVNGKTIFWKGLNDPNFTGGYL